MTQGPTSTKGASMAEIREIGGSWTCMADIPEMPLAKGLRIIIEGAVAGKPEDVECEVVGWQYRLRSREGAAAISALEITVKEVASPGMLELIASRVQRSYADLSDETRFFGPMILSILFAILAAAFAWTAHVDPQFALALLGRHIQTIGDCVIVVFSVWLLARWRGGTFFFALQMLTVVVIWACWQGFTALPPHFGGTDADYAAYLRTLAVALSKSYWPIVVAALPWLSLATKLFGMEQAGRIVDGLEKVGRKKE